MAIKVSVGEPKPQEVKNFPKLMKVNRGNGFIIVEVHRHPTSKTRFIGIHRTGEHKGLIALDFSIKVNCTDYNEEITLKNE